jgi:hypothetical protein
MKITCHSGGCPGADMAWEECGKEYNIKTISYSYQGHTQYGENPYLMNNNELQEGWENILIADKSLNRHIENCRSTYVRKLLCRNWYQVKHSETVMAIGFIEKDMKSVKGGTGWAVQMGIDNNKTIFVFNQNDNLWYYYDYHLKRFQLTKFNGKDQPHITPNFAGIGTRELTDEGLKAIAIVLKMNFGKKITIS